ncbi:MAG: type II toxin-antitoxin system Phd/YefM family antitoxin [Parasporobacterium sp.]|nr:type II toxin-antitoxin system Phd/YefM family antitoxin [Parasporobacterium sp.]
MTTTTITNLRKNIFSLVETAIKYNEPLYITSKDGNAVILSEDEYRGLLETIDLLSVPGMKDKLIDGMQTPLADTVSENEVSW